MTQSDAIYEALREAWAEIVEDAPFPGLDDDLLNSEAYESLVVAEMIEALEERFEIDIPDAVLVPQHVGTIRRIQQTISEIIEVQK